MGGSCCIGDNPIVNFIRDNPVKNFFEDLLCDDSPCGYHPSQVKTTSHAQKTANELAEMKTKMQASTQEAEQKILNWVDKSVENLIKEVENINKEKFGDKELNIDIEGIKVQNNTLKNDVIGFMSEYISNRLVLTDPELSLILKEPDDNNRKKNFDSFYKRIYSESIDKLSDKIAETVKKQQDMIEREIKSRLNEVNSSMEESETAYLKLQDAKEKGEQQVAVERAKHIYEYEIANILSEIVNE